METQRQITLKFFFIMLFMFSLIIIELLISNKNMTEDIVKDKAIAIAETVKDGLTAHMTNGIMDKRSNYLKNIADIQSVDEIWLIRGEKVDKQYGKGLSFEQPKDNIDKRVIKTGKQESFFDDTLIGHSSYRITIPYIATSKGNIDCMSCHEAKEGDTLGAISLIIDIDGIKKSNIDSLSYVVIISLLLIIVTIYLVNHIIGPYVGVFGNIKKVIDKAHQGDYSGRLKIVGDSENKEVASKINNLLEKLENTLQGIDNDIKVFIDKKKISDDPLIDIKYVVKELSEVYKFRKTIEHDDKLIDIYIRLSYMLKNNFHFNNFLFVEADTTNKKTKVVYQEGELLCKAEEGCRADRTNTVVDSCQFANLCDKVKAGSAKQYLCIPYSISNDLDFIISIVLDNEEELREARKVLPDIKNYMEAAKPEIVSKKLMQTLEKTARTDALTGLYNRKYLEETIEFINKQKNRHNVPYGILMVDIDYFKKINDTYGHDIGDIAIRTISDTLTENVRDSDMVIRYGGEEFIVLLYNCDPEYIVTVAETIRESFSKKKIEAGGGESFHKTISIGASIYPLHSESFWKCIKYSDLALYYAKHNGRNQVKLFDKSLTTDEDLGEEY